MTKIKIGIVGTIATRGFVAVLLQFQTARALTAEFDRARQGTEQLIALRKKNESFTGTVCESLPEHVAPLLLHVPP